MEYKLFGRTGVYISPLVLGCMMFGQKTDLEGTCKIIDHALGEGINFLDTADVYGKGASEEFVGEALQRNGKRKDVFLATKVNGRMSDEPNAIGTSRLHIIEGCEDSLRRLKTDRIDLWQFHNPRMDALERDELWTFLATARALQRHCGTGYRALPDRGQAPKHQPRIDRPRRRADHGAANGQHRALGLVQRDATEPQEPRLSTRVIWAMTDTAISAGAAAPMSSPTGA